MMHFKKEIKDEKEGEEKYEKMAKKYPSRKKMFEKMAEDEECHAKKLSSVKGKALAKKAGKK